MERLPGDETNLLQEVLNRTTTMLRHYDLRLSYSVDVEDNSYTVDVLPTDLDHVGVQMRLQSYKRLVAIAQDIVSATDASHLESAIQRARCELDPVSLYVVDSDHEENA